MKEEEQEKGVAAHYATQQILLAYSAGDASKRASRGCFPLHSGNAGTGFDPSPVMLPYLRSVFLSGAY
jgi:hypothetical protein